MLLISFLGFQVQGQEEESEIFDGIYLGFQYGAYIPAGDLADRFGNNFGLGANIEVLKNKKWVYGVEGQFHFGRNVQESVAGELVDERGVLINTSFNLADVDVRERGIHIFGKFGRVHDLWHETSISGIKWTFGVGYLQHKIRLKDADQAVPYFDDPYVRGYDRLTAGFSLDQFVGYQYLDRNGRLNVYVGLEFIEAFTKSQRGLNYNTKIVDDQSRVDILMGAKIGLQITIRSYKDKDDIWY